MTLLSLYPRLTKSRIAEALLDTPVVLIAGSRQSGKTTLVCQIAEHKFRYLTLDNQLILLSAREDPVGLIRSLLWDALPPAHQAIYDEIAGLVRASECQI